MITHLWKDTARKDLGFLSQGDQRYNTPGDPPSGRTTGVLKVELFFGFSF